MPNIGEWVKYIPVYQPNGALCSYQNMLQNRGGNKRQKDFTY